MAPKIPGHLRLGGDFMWRFIIARYAFAHPTKRPGWFSSIPALPWIIRLCRSSRRPPRANPANGEERDYLQVERDAWAARKRIEEIPVTVITVPKQRENHPFRWSDER
jgi:hypothetical protein